MTWKKIIELGRGGTEYVKKEEADARIKELEAELEAVMQKDAPALVRALYEHGRLDATFEGFVVRTFGELIGHHFGEAGGKNYIEITVWSEATGPILVTFQRTEGKTPHQLKAEAEAALATADRKGWERGREDAAKTSHACPPCTDLWSDISCSQCRENKIRALTYAEPRNHHNNCICETPIPCTVPKEEPHE